MSRIGKQPVAVPPSGVDVSITGQNVSVKGPKAPWNSRWQSRSGWRVTTTAPSW